MVQFHDASFGDGFRCQSVLYVENNFLYGNTVLEIPEEPAGINGRAYGLPFKPDGNPFLDRVVFGYVHPLQAGSLRLHGFLQLGIEFFKKMVLFFCVCHILPRKLSVIAADLFSQLLYCFV